MNLLEGPCSQEPFKAVHRNIRLGNGGRLETVRDKEKRGSVDQCAQRCLRKPGCGAFNYHVASKTCAYKGVPKDDDYEKNDKKGKSYSASVTILAQATMDTKSAPSVDCQLTKNQLKQQL